MWIGLQKLFEFKKYPCGVCGKGVQANCIHGTSALLGIRPVLVHADNRQTTCLG